jgi:hypothetical protein
LGPWRLRQGASPDQFEAVGQCLQLRREQAPDNHGHERTPNPEVGHVARWSLNLLNLADKDEASRLLLLPGMFAL